MCQLDFGGNTLNRGKNAQTPRKITDVILDRKISWLELFYDLVFVAALHAITSSLAEHWSGQNVVTALLLFVGLYRIWQELAWFFDLHGRSTVRINVIIMLIFAGLVAVAITTPGVFNGHWTYFIIAYLVVHLLVTYNWWTTGYYDPQHRVTSYPYTFIHSVISVLLIAMVFASSAQLNQFLFLSFQIIAFCTPMLIHRAFEGEVQTRGLEFQVSDSLQERYGEFTMIILGEGVATLIELGTSATGQPIKFWWVATTLLMIIAIWWLYYTLVDGLIIKGKRYRTVWWYRILNVGWSVLLVGSLFAGLYQEEIELSPFVLTVSVALSLLVLLLSTGHYQSKTIFKKPWLMLLVAMMIGLVGGLPAFLILPGLDLILVILIICVERIRSSTDGQNG